MTKRNFKHTKERRKTGIKAVLDMGMGQIITVYYGHKKKSTNRTTWSPDRSHAEIRRLRYEQNLPQIITEAIDGLFKQAEEESITDIFRKIDNASKNQNPINGTDSVNLGIESRDESE